MEPKDMIWVEFREYAESGHTNDREWHANYMANIGITLICRSVYIRARMSSKTHDEALTKMIDTNVSIRTILGWAPPAYPAL